MIWCQSPGEETIAQWYGIVSHHHTYVVLAVRYCEVLDLIVRILTSHHLDDANDLSALKPDSVMHDIVYRECQDMTTKGFQSVDLLTTLRLLDYCVKRRRGEFKEDNGKTARLCEEVLEMLLWNHPHIERGGYRKSLRTC